MPRRVVYIRKEDEELWDKLRNKSLAVHEMLNGEEFSIHNTSQEKLRVFVEKVVEQVLARERGY